MNEEAEKEKIRQVITSWLRASQTGDTDALLRLMAEDVVFLLPGQEPMRGRAAFAAAMRSTEAKFRLAEGTPQIQEIRIAGDFAICWNYLDLQLEPLQGGEPLHRAGHILSVFRREPEGHWVLFRDANLLGPPKGA